jgi:hypothetical protein
MSYAKRKKNGVRLPPFVPMIWDMLNHNAYRALPVSAAKALPYFLGKVKTKGLRDPSRYSTAFSFSYREAHILGYARGTHHRNICVLMEHSFIDPHCKGGMKSMGYSVSQFKLSMRWLQFGTPEFKIIRWETFLPKFTTLS